MSAAGRGSSAVPGHQYGLRGEGCLLYSIGNLQNLCQVLLFPVKALSIALEDGRNLIRGLLNLPDLLHRKSGPAQYGNLAKRLQVLLGIGAIGTAVLIGFFRCNQPLGLVEANGLLAETGFQADVLDFHGNRPPFHAHYTSSPKGNVNRKWKNILNRPKILASSLKILKKGTANTPALLGRIH